MQNLLEKFSPEAEVEKGDEGMVLIEYVVFGGVIAAGIVAGLVTGFFADLKNKLDTIIAA